MMKMHPISDNTEQARSMTLKLASCASVRSPAFILSRSGRFLPSGDRSSGSEVELQILGTVIGESALISRRSDACKLFSHRA